LQGRGSRGGIGERCNFTSASQHRRALSNADRDRMFKDRNFFRREGYIFMTESFETIGTHGGGEHRDTNLLKGTSSRRRIDMGEKLLNNNVMSKSSLGKRIHVGCRE